MIAAYFLLNVGVGLYYYRRASGGISEFFVSGRDVPWWLAGTSMVATTFAADTPLAVTGMVARYGIAGNWLWWNYVMSGMLTVFLYARLWRRAGVLTDTEFAELRYSGRPAAFLRGFRAFYLGLPVTCIVMGWINLAMAKILSLTLGITKLEAVLACLFLTAAYTALSGLWGVLVTDTLQFVIKMTMTIVLAVFCVRAVGGVEVLKAKVAALGAGHGGSALSFVPELGSAWMPLLTFFVYISVNWWAAWYPGAEPGGGGFIAQRMFSAKDEKHSLLATLWFNIAHYTMRTWPWVMVALAAMVLYPGLRDPEIGYVQAMMDHLPHSLRGLMLAGFFAAYMSSISTMVNLSASYMINDLYRRFLRPQASERRLVAVSRAATLLAAVLSAVVTYFLSSIEGAWKLLIAIGAGTGPVLILRWYWWRINAWSEVAAMAASFAASVGLQYGAGLSPQDPRGFAWLMILTTAIATATWLAVTWLTPPEPQEKLVEFYERVHPGGPGWKAVAALSRKEAREEGPIGGLFLDWIAGCVLIYTSMFGVGKIILHEYAVGALLLATAAAAGSFIYWDLSRRGWETIG